MSHEATTWAFRQRGLTPSQFRVLVQLADRHNPDYGCFPSQENLARDCEVSRATVNRCLDELEALGMIFREAVKDAQGRQKNTRYTFAFERTNGEDSRVSYLDTVKPAVSHLEAKPCLIGETHNKPVSEPVNTTLLAHASDIETEEGWPTSNWPQNLIAKTNCADPARDIWPIQTQTVLLGWKTAGIAWCDAVNGVRAVMARGAVRARTWGYFENAVAQAKANRLRDIALPPPDTPSRQASQSDDWTVAIATLTSGNAA